MFPKSGNRFSEKNMLKKGSDLGSIQLEAKRPAREAAA